MGLLLWSHARRHPGLYPLAAALLAAAAACRPVLVPAVLVALADTWLVAKARPAIAMATTILAVGLGTAALYANWHIHGSLLGGRTEVVSAIRRSHAVYAYFHFSPTHLAGLLVAPSRGVFVYSPVLLFAIPGLLHSLRAGQAPAARLISVAGILTFLLYGFIATWWGGRVFGPRYMTDLLPFFAFWLVSTPLPRRGRPFLAAAFALALSWSVGVQQLGALAYPCGEWDAKPRPIDKHPERLWSLRDTQIGRCAAELAGRPRGGWGGAR
jgi:hypothetical protein